MLKRFLLMFSVAAATIACAQKGNDVFNAKEVLRIENILAADDMRGRKAGTPDSDKAAAFIAAEFKKAGLEPVKGSYLQEFAMVTPKQTLIKYEADDKEADVRNVIVISTEKDFKVNEKSGYTIHTLAAGDPFVQKVTSFMQEGKNIVVFVDTSFSKDFPRVARFRRQLMTGAANAVFILGAPVQKFTVKAEQEITEAKFMNVVGILPGKTKKSELVIFSAHYDHIGIARQPQNGDSIFNGANDDAAGTTAVILLANHFKKLNNNERTLVFAAFTAEEIGGFGSQYFSKQYDPNQVVAMFNIEMIGTESKWGKNSAYITGYDKTNMGEILQKNLKGSSFTFYPDPYTKENLFYRSDNATLARLGVAAHTISTAKMENEPNYHKVSDEVSTLDISNMTEIIRAIALSATSIISGSDTPSRVKTDTLN